MNVASRMYERARAANDALVRRVLREAAPLPALLDVGCWDGALTRTYAEAAGAAEVFGIELVERAAEEARGRGIRATAIRADSDRWPYEDGSIDCVVSNQVVEHLSNLDHYFSEASRVLRRDGILVSATNNLASWHNVAALVLGWAPFDLTNSSVKAAGIGNPLSAHRAEDVELASWTHRCVYTPRWLFEWQALYGLRPRAHYGAGWYPFPASLGTAFPRHAAFMILATEKA